MIQYNISVRMLMTRSRWFRSRILFIPDPGPGSGMITPPPPSTPFSSLSCNTHTKKSLNKLNILISFYGHENILLYHLIFSFSTFYRVRFFLISSTYMYNCTLYTLSHIYINIYIYKFIFFSYLKL